MNARVRKTKQMPMPVLPETIIGVAAEQIADLAIREAMDEIAATLANFGFDVGDNPDGTTVVSDLAGWDALQEEIERLIINFWTTQATEVERAMREAGVEPASEYGLSVPKGVVPS